jgi:hypothetical protein
VSVQHGKLTLDVPRGWVDNSSIVYVAPPATGLGASLSGRPAPSYRSNVTVSVEQRPDALATPREFLGSLGDALRRAGLEVSDLSTTPFVMSDRKGALATRRVRLDGQLVRQWTAVVYLGPNVIVATASTTESEAAKDEPELLRLLGSVRVADGT